MSITHPVRFEATLLVCVLMMSSAASADARRSISPAPGSPSISLAMDAPAAERPLELPFWLGVEAGGGSSHAQWEGLEGDGFLRPFGVTLLTPASASHWRQRFSTSLDLSSASRWYRESYYDYVEHVVISYPRQLLASRTLFAAEVTWERMGGVEAKPWGFLGAGLALGVGEEYRSNRPDADGTSTLQFVSRTGLYLYSSSKMRFGFAARGAIGFPFTGSYGDETQYSAAALISVERSLLLPRRFVPASN